MDSLGKLVYSFGNSHRVSVFIFSLPPRDLAMYSLVYMHGYGFVLLNIDQRNTVMLKIKKMGHQFFTFIRTFLQHQQLHVARKRDEIISTK